MIPTRQALEVAEERGLDLVEVASTASPPVCRILDYGKFRYDNDRKEKEERKARKNQKINDVRQVRMKPRIGDHDREAKTRMVKRLLGEGSKVKVTVMFRGREMDHPEVGMGLLKSVAEDLVDDAALEKTPGFEGRWLSMVLTPIVRTKQNQAENGNKEPEIAKT